MIDSKAKVTLHFAWRLRNVPVPLHR